LQKCEGPIFYSSLKSNLAAALNLGFHLSSATNVNFTFGSKCSVSILLNSDEKAISLQNHSKFWKHFSKINFDSMLCMWQY
jgi:hypothetical protein